jgi:hypothetical protein
VRAHIQSCKDYEREIDYIRSYFDWISAKRYALAVRLGELLNRSADEIWGENDNFTTIPPPERWWEKKDV